MIEPPPPLDATLTELAAAFDIATEYWDWQGRHVAVPAETIVRVLGGPRMSTPALPKRPGGRSPSVHIDRGRGCCRRAWPCARAARPRSGSTSPHGDPVETWIELETGERPLRAAPTGELGRRQREVDGRWVGEASFEIPADLPLGYHTLHARSSDQSASMPLIITPAWLGLPPRMGQHRGWGFAAQLYSVRSGSPGPSVTSSISRTSRSGRRPSTAPTTC